MKNLSQFIWETRLAECHVWYWFLRPDLPNGWAASVCDDTQASSRKQPTSYRVFASAKFQMVQAPKSYSSLAEAKREALLLAMAQPKAAETNEELEASIRRQSA